MQNQFFSKSVTVLSLIIYLVVNGLFIVKYGTFGLAGNVMLFVIYSVIILAAYFLASRIKRCETFLKYIFWGVVVAFFIFTLVLNHFVKLESLNVDRLDALDRGIKAVLNGEYPYNQVNRLGNESSNLPVLILTGLPFYLLFGSAVYLQSFSFLLFSYIIYRCFFTYRGRFFALLLLILSPSYVYELYVKSDLFSNFIIASGFVLLIWNRFIKSDELKLPLVAFSSALLVLTRIPVVIPLAIVLVRKWVALELQNKILFTAIFLITIASVVSVFMNLAPDFNVIREHNPLLLQSKQPIYLSVLVIVTAVFFSFRVKNLFSIMLSSGVLLFASVFISFLLASFKKGLHNTYMGSYFDISHFNMAMPFIIISLASGLHATKDCINK